MIENSAPGLAATKLRPPVPPERLVRRARLDDVLDAAVEARTRLILVSAPAGSGKSTLLGSWLADRTELVAWLQVEKSDSDPVRFWSFLVEAIGRVVPTVADDLRPLVAGSGGDVAVVVPALVNRLSEIGDRLVVVVDDYHLIESPTIHLGVERLIDLCPSQLSLVLATRFDPPFRMGRLRVRGHVAEIRPVDLRFGPDEASGLLGDAGGVLDPGLLSELCERTEGWAAGLVLAGLSLKRSADPGDFVGAFRGDDELVVEYVRDEFLTGLGADDRRILLETSILDQLHGDLVDAVTASTGGTRWLRETAEANQLLVGLDRTRTWFRHHHLLRDLLRLEAQETLPHALPELHRRAASWFESEGDHGRAIGHRLDASDTVAAARLLRVHGPQLLRAGQIETLRGLLDQLGEETAADTACALLSGWCEFIGGRYGRAEAWIDTALEVAPAGFDELLTTPLRINVSLARGDVGPALAVARTITRDELVSHPSDLATAVGAAHAWAGRGDDAISALEVAVERAHLEDSHSAHSLALVYRAIVELEHGSTPSAWTAASNALETAQRFGLGGYHGVAPAYAIRARTGENPEHSRADVSQALHSARRASTRLAFAYVLTLCADTLLDLGDPRGEPLLAEARSVIDRCPDPGMVASRVARAESRHGVGPTRRAPVDALVEQLTERETAVLRYLPTTMSQRDIASELYVSPSTVKTHCRAIYRKLGVGDRGAAVRTARDLELL